MHHLCLLCADGEAKVRTCCGKVVHAQLHFKLVGCVQCAVVCKEEVADCGYLHSGLGLESSQIEKLAVSAVAHVYPQMHPGMHLSAWLRTSC